MSKNSDQPQLYPTAPSAPDDFQRGPPPPSYEECFKMSGALVTPHQYTYSNPTAYQQQQAFIPPPSFPAPGPSSSYGYANPYQTHIQQQQIFYNTANPSPPTGIPRTENVLYLAKGAKVKTTATGAISIPPPPPGCAPTPGQLAAMSGQPVMIKKVKKSFF